MSSESAVTPAGVRDGEPDALRGLVARRGPAVLAYCAAVCEPDVAPRAAAEAFARFRGAVAAASEPGALAPEPLLLGATRHSAASMARTAPQAGSGLRRVLGDRGANDTCALVPTLLAAQADGMLSPDDQERLRRHLDRHPACRTIEAGFRQAQARYDAPPDRPVPPAVERLVLHALVAAAPLAPGVDPSGLLDAGATEEEDAIAAAQETQDWAAADVAAAVAAADAQATAALPVVPEPVAPEPVPEPLAPEPEPEPEVVVAEEDDEELYEDDLHDDDEPFEDPSAAPEVVVATAPAPDDDPEEGLLDDDEHEHDAVDERDLTTVMPAVAAPPRSLRERLHLPSEGDHGPFFRFVLPGAAIVLALLVAMLLAGVFDGDDAGEPTGRVAPAPAAALPAAAPVTASEAAAPVREPEPERPARPKRSRPARTTTAPTTTPAPVAESAATPSAAPPAATPAPAPAPASRRTTTARPKARPASPTAAEKAERRPSLPGAQTTATSPADEPVFTPGESQP